MSPYASGNPYDDYAIAAYQVGGDLVIGHLPREISRWSAFFLNHGGSIEGTVSGVRRYSRVAGGMEIPCKLVFQGKKRHITKLKRLIDSLNSLVVYNC